MTAQLAGPDTWDPVERGRDRPLRTDAAPALRARRRRWVDGYVHRLVITDVIVIVLAVVAADLLRFGTDPQSAPEPLWVRAWTSTALGVLWIGWLALEHTRGTRVVGNGADEYRRVCAAVLRMFGTVAILALVFRLDVARGYLAIAFPAGTLGLVADRWFWRRWLTVQRLAGTHSSAVLVVGSAGSAADITACFERDRGAGYRVVGVCVPGHRHPVGQVLSTEEGAVPVLGDEHEVVDALRRSGADTVAVTGGDRLGHAGMRALTWQLQELDVDLVVAPGIVDVAGPRIQVRPVAGLPLVHVEEPQYEGAGRVTKMAFDIVAAAVALVVLCPLMLAAALAVRLGSRGPVFYRQERVGLSGNTFQMYKFRSMVDGADRALPGITADDGNGVLFKLHHDPRVTPVGRLLRRASIDELPQLFNVLRGEMSLVGPRPPLRSEVVTYTCDVRRRLLVKPGLTGLWQVSGRSDLSWEETVRLDLSYVENWSMVADLLIISRTVRAVLAGRGAY